MQLREESVRGWARVDARRFGMAGFLAALILLLAAIPFVDGHRRADLIEALLLTLVLGAALLAVGGRRRSLALAAVLAVPCLAGKWGHYCRPDLVPAEIFLATGLLLVAFIVAQVLLWILRAPRVDSEVLCAGIAGYLLLALLWALAYLLLARLQPGCLTLAAHTTPARALTGFDALYFSFSTLTTVDYGDIVPLSRAARLLAMAEAAAGVFYMAIVIARLVALHTTQQIRER